MDLKGALRRLEDNLRNQPGNIVGKSGEKIVARYILCKGSGLMQPFSSSLQVSGGRVRSSSGVLIDLNNGPNS